MKKGYVYIIPDENQILNDCFLEEVYPSHLKGIQKFCDMYQLGYQFEESQYNDAPCILSLDGHMVIKTLEDISIAIFYLPEFVTDRQAMWFFQHQNQFSHYQLIQAAIISGDKNHIQKKSIHGLTEVQKYVSQSNFAYSKKNNYKTI